MGMEAILLGTGTSTGVPMVGCDCAVCRSDDPRDRRLRASALLRWEGHAVVIDTTPEFRLQMLAHDVRSLDAVLLTHAHADHVHGLDDVRPYGFGRPEAMPVYGPPNAMRTVRKHFAYVWEATQQGGGLPRIDLHPVEAPFRLHGVEFLPVPALHGELPVYGYRVGDFAYLTDVSAIPPASLSLLGNLRTLVLDAVRYRPHATHFHVDAALEAAARIGAEQTYLTHMNHEIAHARLAAACPPGVSPAFDGQVIAVAR